jgi:tripartite-type tricarboxylate transporter receptor subunit TctC
MFITRTVAQAVAVTTMVLAAGAAFAQNYPSKTIRVLTGSAGGSNDLISRLVTQGLSGPLGQPVVVENRSALVSAELVANAPPDGHTLLLNGSTVWLLPYLQKTPYDPIKDFAPVTLLSTQPNVLVVHPSLPVKSVKELIALARAKPGEMNYASASIASSSHLAAELFKAMTAINIVHIPYKGSGAATIGLIGGHVQLTFAAPGSVAASIKSGKLRAVAVTSAQPSALLPGLPTVAATVPGYETVAMTGIFAPAATPAAIVNRLSQEVARLYSQGDVKAKFFEAGMEAIGNTPEQFAAAMKSDMARMGRVIKDAGIRAE